MLLRSVYISLVGRTTSVLITELKIIFHATESIESNPVTLILFTIFTRDRIEKKKRKEDLEFYVVEWLFP